MIAARDAAATTATVVVVLGPPCSGKTTYVNEHITRGDIVIDFDAIASALGSGQDHEHDEVYRTVALAARKAAIEAAVRTRARVWVILTFQRQIDQFHLHPATTHVMSTALAECERRAIDQARSDHTLEVIRTWTL